MRAFVLQDWVTIRGATAVNTVIQNEASYAQLDAYQDVAFWLQVAEFTLPGTGTLTMNYETAPIKDESLFSAMATKSITATIMTPPFISNVILSQNPAVPLSRWVRWHLTTASATAAWDVTFRILLVANQQFTFVPRSMGA
jgi:hypothetical protein